MPEPHKDPVSADTPLALRPDLRGYPLTHSNVAEACGDRGKQAVRQLRLGFAVRIPHPVDLSSVFGREAER